MGDNINLKNKNTYKYGIFQSSEFSCVFYKEDKEGNQSTFNLFVLPEEKGNKIFAYIDNFYIEEKVWHSVDNISIEKTLQTFNEWAIDAPVLFELEAQKSITRCFKNYMIQK